MGIIHTHLFEFFSSTFCLGQTEWAEREGKAGKGLEGAVPATRADVRCLEPSQRDTLHFKNH